MVLTQARKQPTTSTTGPTPGHDANLAWQNLNNMFNTLDSTIAMCLGEGYARDDIVELAREHGWSLGRGANAPEWANITKALGGTGTGRAAAGRTGTRSRTTAGRARASSARGGGATRSASGGGRSQTSGSRVGVT